MGWSGCAEVGCVPACVRRLHTQQSSPCPNANACCRLACPCHTVAGRRGQEDSHILDDGASCRPDAWAAAAYGPGFGGGGRGDDEGPREPVYCPELGLAIEAPRDPGVTIRQLWCVL